MQILEMYDFWSVTLASWAVLSRISHIKTIPKISKNIFFNDPPNVKYLNK